MSLLTAEKRKLLAQRLKERGIDPGARAEPIPRRPPGPARPSFAQQRLWVLDQLEPGSPFYNIAAAADLLGRLDVAVLARSFGEIVRRHEALRTVFVAREGQPFQEVLEPPSAGRPWRVPVVDLAGLPEAAARAEADRLNLAEARRPFDLAQGPLLRTTLLRLGSEEHALLVTMHHIVSDGWSHGVFLGEMAALYPAFAAGMPSPLPELPVQYPDFAEWQREWLAGERLETQLAYWRGRLQTGAAAGPPPLELPADRPRPPLQTYRGARVPVAVPRGVTDALAARSREEGGTLFMVLLAAFDALLARHTGKTDLAVGSPVANRRRADLEGLIGFFTNTLVLRVDAGGDPTFRELLGRARDTAQEAYAHQDIPFERLVEELQPERDASRTPLFQVMLVLQNAPAHGLAIPGLRVVRREGDPGVAKFDLMLDLTEAPDGLRGALEYNADLYDGTRIQRMAGHLLAVLEGAAGQPGRRLSDLPLLSAPERHQVVAEWNAPAATESPATVVSTVVEQARRLPDAPALEDPAHGVDLTYAELVRRADGLARKLQRMGVGPETRVAISLDRSAEMAVSVLAVLRAGGAYVPVDPAYPEERRALMLADAGARVVLDRQSLPEIEPEIETTEEGRAPLPLPDPGSLAYVLFTSGSTGRPKGVAMPHGALANLIGWQLGDMPGAFRTLQFASFSFDVHFQEIFATWCAGGTVVMAGDEMRRDPAALLGFLEERSVERLFLPFVALQGLAEAAQGRPRLPAGLREVVTAGEALQRTPAVVSLFRRLPRARLYNQYGPTEAHVVTSHLLTGDPEEWPLLPPIGRAISGDRVHVLDRDGGGAPLGVPGELVLGGAGLARGYLGRPDLTAEKFVPDPLAESGRVYRTGDLGRFRFDGALEFLGRIDQQVKVRGFRVEPGEVEAALAAHPAVREAAVTVEGEGAARRLVGYVTGTVSDPAEVRRFLAGRLPDYLVPAAVVILEALPLTPSGKVDRRALGRHAPQAALPVEGYVAPRTPAEEVLAGIWTDVLGLERAGAHDDFFALGGHSLLGTQVVSRIRGAFGVEVPLRALFEEPTLAGLARRIEAAFRAETGTEEAPPLVPVPRGAGEGLPLSFAQQRLWFVDQLDPGTPRYNIPLAVRLEGPLAVPALENALAEIVRRHEALRTAFVAAGSEPVQVVRPAVPAVLPVVDLADLPEAAREAEAADLAGREAARPFDLAQPPWLRGVLLREGEDVHGLLLTQHHIASDGWSIGVLVRELTALYGAFAAGRPSPLPPLPIQYADFAVWQRSWLRGETLQRELGYWRERLAGLPPRLDLPADRSPAVPSYRGGRVDVRLAADVTAAVRERARQSGATVFMVLLAAWQALLARLSGQSDLAVGTPIAGRNRLETEGLIGFFVNALVLRASLGDDPSFSEHLARTREAALGAFAHPDLPFEKLVEELAPERHLSHTPLFQVVFILQNTPSPKLALPGLRTVPVPVGSGAVRFELTLSLTEAGEEIGGTVEFAADRFDAVTAQRWLGGFETLLEGSLESPGTPVSAFPLLRGPELFQLLAEWNDTGGDLPGGDLCLHELFEAQVDRTPEALAVTSGGADGGTLTYRELDARAGALARRLREAGIGPEVRAGVFADRSLEAVVAYVAVAKAGGVFVPLDPDYPRERLAYLVEDAAPALVLAQDHLRERLPASFTAVFSLNGILDGPPEELPARLAPAVAPENAAYVLYTSGSTGRPKGVVVSHRAIVNRILWGLEVIPYTGEDRILQKTPPSFDVSVTELFAPLVSGACLVVSAPGEHRDPAAMVERVIREGVTYLQVVPTLLRLLLEEPDLERCASLRWLVCGGEALDRDSVERVLARLPVPLVNFYGPAEAAVDSTWRPFRRGERGLIVPIGRPVTNLRVYVVDRSLRPLPVGVPGELCVAGTGLARGYLDRPDLTAERFLPDPFASVAGERLYRTGDLARWLPQGEIDYLGRVDNQIKLRGVRIELEEIEAVLAGHPAVRTAAVVVRGEGADRRLIGYVLPRAGFEEDTAEDTEAIEASLRAFVRESLPEIMVPSALVVLDEMPLTPGGKVDRLRLLREGPEPDRDGKGGGEAPRTPAETALAGIWAEILRTDRVGIHDDFFALGGHSLLATRVVSRVREAFGVEMPVRLLFEEPTVAGLAGWIERERGASPGALSGRIEAAADEDGDAPLSFAQQRLWFIDRFEPGNSLYNAPIFLRARGDLRPAVLGRVLEEVQRRHEALRTVFPTSDGVPVQRVLPAGPVLLPVVDLSALPAEVREESAVRLARAEARRPFDLAAGPVWRPLLVRLRPEEHLALFTLHHIVSDGWSLGVLVREVGTLYAAFAKGRPSPLPELAVQYRTFARWQRQWLAGEVLERELAYWRRQLAGPPAVLELPADHPRPKAQSAAGATRPVRFSAALTAALQDLARREGATLFMVLLAGYQAFLSRLTGQTDVTVGSPVAGRTRLETEPLIGVFVNTLVLRGDLSADPPFRDLLAQARETALAAHAHQAVPFEKLVEELEPERDLAHTPLFQTMLVLQNAAAETLELPGLTLEPAEPPEGLLATSPFELSLILGEQEGGLTGGWEHSTVLFDGATIERWSGWLARLLERAAADPGTPVSALPLLGEAERAQVLVEWSGVVEAGEAAGTVHERIERRAALSPDALALVAGEDRWTYAELDAQAERWARRLRQLGAGPEVPVAVSLERSAEAMAVLLGVLKAGAVYLPIDPAMPERRREDLLRDSGAAVVVSGSDLLSRESSGDPRAASQPGSGYEPAASVVGAQFIAPASAWPVRTVRLSTSAWPVRTVRFSVRTAAGAMNCAPTTDAERRREEERRRRAVGVSPRAVSHNLAYIIYTSGSTGEPKGVAVEHGALLAHLETTCRAYGLSPGDRVLQLSSLSFDASLEQILGAWLAGATLVLRDRDLWSPAELLGRLAELEITVADLPTAYWQQWVREMVESPAPAPPEPRLRLVSLGGEAMPLEEARLWAGTPAGGARLFNAYGPTEAVITATGYPVPPGGPPRGSAVPVGRSLPGRAAWILDRSGEPVPPGVAGELCLAGPLARGYLNRPAATAERFVPDPWSGTPGARIYRSGDLARWGARGEIEFLGRTDRQVKVRGFRIEVGEIEAALAGLPGIRECAVEVQGDGEERTLAAFLAGPDVPPAAELRERLRERLPAYMIPAAFAVLPELPLTPGGKIDRRALSRLAAVESVEPGDEAAYVAPRDPVEETVAAAWRDLLGRERIGVHDSFFDLGGHSLLATRVTARLQRAFGVEVPLRDLFEGPTVAGLAARVRRSLAGAPAVLGIPPLVPVPREDRPLPLSFAQQRLWFLDRLEPGSAVYNIPTALRLSGSLDVPALAAALAEIVRRHEALRTVFEVEGGEPVQRVLPAAPAGLPLVDLAGLPDAVRDAEARRLAWAEAAGGFDLESGPLLRALLVRLGAREHDAHLTLHHIVGDGWSKGVLLREIAVLYGAFQEGRPSPLPPLPVQYGDYAVWQRSWLRGEVLEAEIGHWRRELADLPAWLDIPTDHPRPPLQTTRGALRLFGLPPAAGAALHELARERGATMFMVLLAAFQALLGRLSGQDRLAVGTPVAGRNRLETEGLIGFFANTLVLRGDLTGDPAFGELVGRAREVSLTAQAHPEVPFEKLVEELAPERSLSHSPLFQEMLVFQNTPEGAVEMPGLAVRTLPAGTGTAKFDLTLSAGPAADGGLNGALEYNTNLFEPATAERIVRWLLTLLDGAAARPDLPLSALPLLAESERHQLQAEWNDRPDPGLPWPSLHAAFESQAARTPDAPALIWEGERISYRDLDLRANRLAHHLVELGAGPERVVAVRLPRTPELVVTLLAVLKSGSAYLPLDPAYPEDRIAFMLADAGAVVEVRSSSPLGGGGLDQGGGQVGGGSEGQRGRPNVFLEQVAPLLTSPLTQPPPPRGEGPAPRNLAYLIYTSGSTGRPKGVAIEHASAVRMLAWAGGAFSREELAGVLASTSVNFDISVFELFVPLAYGGTVILAENALALPSLPAACEVTLLNTVPSAAAALLDLGPLPASIRTVNLAGEALRRPLVDRVHAAGIPRVLNLYGPSEDTTYSTVAVVPRGEAGEPSIGRPIDGTQAYVVDGPSRLAPLGIPGELLLGGGGLARGYLGRPALTAEKWIPDPFGKIPGERLYRTGDRVRLRPDGNLEFLSRFDHQVKIRGFRIELGEIEALLAAQPSVREAVVAVRDETPAGRRLVAYIALQEEGSVPELREALRQRLPEPMVPAVFVEMEALPRTPNGKVDRAALPAPEASAAETGAAAPRTPTEELLAEIWSAVLGREQVGADDDFFRLGGHSLLAVRVVARIREAFGVELPVRALFEAPSLAALAEKVEEARREDRSPAPPLRAVPRGRDLPLSFAQERLWLLDRLEPGNPAYHLPTYVRFEGDLRPAALERSLEHIAARHEVLRTVFAVPAGGGGRPVQRVLPPPAPGSLRLPEIDLRALPEDRREAEARHLAVSEAREAFDLETAGPLRARRVRLGDLNHLLLLTVHHAAYDATSGAILIRELAEAYPAFLTGRKPDLPELPVQYADYAAWQREWLQGEALESQLAYWRRRLAGAPPVDLPADRPRPAARSGRGATVPVSFPADLAAGLAEMARREGATLFMVLVAGYQTWLARLSGQTDPSVGTPVANRSRRELEGLIGFFINTLVLRGDAPPSRGFREQVARARRTALEAYDHREVPFEKIVEELVPARDLSRTPLFQVMLAFQEAAPPPAADLPGLRLRSLDVDPGGSKFDLSLSLVRGGASLDGVAEFDTDLFDVPTMVRYLRSYETLLRGGVEHPEARLADLPLLDEAERFQLQVEWNDSRSPYPGGDFFLDELVAAQVERTPGAVAVAVDGEELTYRELWDWSAAIAGQLRELGVGPEARVGLYAERCLELVPAILGILRAGGVYVPLDPDHPADRLAYVIKDAAVAVVLAPERLVGAVPPSQAPVVVIGAGRGRPLPRSGGGLGRGGLEAAYILYTSGSTGRPKGVVISHGAIVNRVLWAQADFPLQPSDRTLLKSPISFDASVWEIFAPLVAGARLSLAAPGEHRDPARLAARLADERLTVLVAVPTLLRSLLQEPDFHRSDALRLIFSAGEALAAELKEELLALLPITLVNLYGPTEVAIDATVRTFRRGERDRAVPIGRSLGNVQVYVLDPGLQPVPAGVPGELCVGGAGVARGYHGRPDLTAERFIPDPFAPDPGRRLYRTGDLARRLPDGQVEYLGRVDQQVKLRGVRIELGEVEAALREHPAVREAAVLVRQDLPGGGGLVAFAVFRPDEDSEPSANVLRDHLRGRLPEAMVPSVFVALEALPLTTSGKVDRLALSRIELVAEEKEASAAPRGPVEEIVAAVFADLLSRERIGAGDDFFALGGHSLLAAQVVSRLRVAFGVEVPLRDLFEEPTVAGLSGRIGSELARGEERPAALPPILPVPRDAGLPLSFAQQRLWVIDQIEPESPLYNIPVALRLAGPLDVPALAGALAGVVRRHEALRTVFAAGEGGPIQKIEPAGAVPLPVVDLAALPESRRETAARELAAEEALRPFDLREGPVFRAGLLRLAPDGADHALLLTVHHIVSDGWSAGILVREVTELYRAGLEGRRPSLQELPELPVQYADFAVWQRGWLAGEALARETGYWRTALAGLPAALELPADRPRPAIQTFRGSGLAVELPADLSESLHRLARREGATLFMVLLAGFQALLGRLAGARDLAVGAPVAGRNRVETEGLIGFFVNTLVLRGDLRGEPGLRELVVQARERSIAAHTHQDVPFEKLVEELAPERSLSRSPLFQVALSFQSAPVAAPELPGLALRPLEVAGVTSKFDLTLALAEAKDLRDIKDIKDIRDEKDGDSASRVLGSVEYNTDLFDRTTVQRWMASLERLLAAALAEPERSVWDLPLESESERQQVLREWNDNGLPGWPGEAGLAERFAAMVEAHPDEPALAFTDGRLTYRELDARASRLAHHLLALGLPPEGRAGLFLERSAALIVATLAVIQAGGVYVPLDPSYPAERLGFMVGDAGLSVVITDEALDGRLAEDTPPRVLLDRDSETIAARPATPPEANGGGDRLAYIMYTSGSTGRPKGIGIPHRAVLRLVLRTNYIDIRPGDRVAQAANTSFDAATFEIWGALLNGGCLVGIPREVALSPEDLAEMLARERIAALFLTTALFQQLAADHPDALATVRTLLFGGEIADPARLRGLLARENRPERILHVYGPTEGTTFSTYYPASGDPSREAASVPIGRPIAATSGCLVDPLLRPVPLGSVGELCVGGEGLARGYLGRPGLTAEKFVPDPFSDRPGARLYRTGDLCRWLPSGDLDFLGRFDHQVKLRGFRIELGEIEAALAEQPGVKEAFAMVREDLPGDRRLVAYVVGTSEPAGLKESLRGRLPDYMIPTAFVEMESLPLTPNGKVDRAALPAPEGGRTGSAAAYVEPGTALEREIAAAVKEVLAIDRVGRDDSFFDLGAHSLSMIRIAGALSEKLGRPVKVLEIFRFPNVAALARHLGEAEETPMSREVHDRRADARRQSMGRRREMRKGRS